MVSRPCACRHRRRRNSGTPSFEHVGIAEKMTGRDMPRALKIFSVLGVGMVLGLAATWATVIRSTQNGGVSKCPWRARLFAGLSVRGPFLRGYILVQGLLSLGREATIYHNAASDNARNTPHG